MVQMCNEYWVTLFISLRYVIISFKTLLDTRCYLLEIATDPLQHPVSHLPPANNSFQQTLHQRLTSTMLSTHLPLVVHNSCGRLASAFAG